ncbi:MAG TPA: SH3 domain-containing protein, partial [Caldilineaceae bacterium]|nr:SH3 domain-containing protein [Caldilineaceae bacterium]
MRGRRILRWLWLAALAVMGMAEPAVAAPRLQVAPFTAGRLIEESALRAGPGINFVIVGRLPAGQTVTVLGCNHDCTWYHVGDNRWAPAFAVKPALMLSPPPSQLM